MQNNLLNEYISTIKKSKLGGFSSQKIYSPPYRKVHTEEEIKNFNPKIAAVNILLCPNENNEICFPLIKRACNEKDKHSGQISLPGGSFDFSDENLQTTAIRETSEELGVKIEEINIIRSLTPLYIPVSRFYVHPFISFSIKNLNFEAQISEVQEVKLCPISEIIKIPNPPKTEVLPQSKNTEVPVYQWGNYKIWGATAMILSEFSFMLNKNCSFAK